MEFFHYYFMCKDLLCVIVSLYSFLPRQQSGFGRKATIDHCLSHANLKTNQCLKVPPDQQYRGNYFDKLRRLKHGCQAWQTVNTMLI